MSSDRPPSRILCFGTLRRGTKAISAPVTHVATGPSAHCMKKVPWFRSEKTRWHARALDGTAAASESLASAWALAASLLSLASSSSSSSLNTCSGSARPFAEEICVACVADSSVK
eukprot:CAMPEP_0182810542 /NCGR_PEP_ID=MMETSP0006_2-20121128/7794_1 /TAXON_ID=97485 /ORGANISM="Prymnesium parvum, Strain Texoma1" /LENGTH=114 /DNA_ID=CAMNT_0024936443 /DNA_START=414 /DNA_END=758 /DNA_ORIENTATION=-